MEFSENSYNTFAEFTSSPESRWLHDILISSTAGLAPLAQLCKQNGRGTSRLHKSCFDAAYSSSQDLRVAFGNRMRRYRLFTLSHHRKFLQEILFPAYAWLLRYTAPDYGGEAMCFEVAEMAVRLATLKDDLEAVVMSLWAGTYTYWLVDEGKDVMEAWHQYATVLVQMDTLKCVSQALGGKRRMLLAHQGSLSQLSDRMDDAERALAIVTTMLSAKGRFMNLCPGAASPSSSAFNSALVRSYFLEHACALRLQLADSTALAAHLLRNLQADSKEVSQAKLRSQEVERLPPDAATRHRPFVRAPQDEVLLQLLALCSLFGRQDSISFELGSNGKIVLQSTEPPADELLLWHSLSHPAVQCYLGWWLVGPMVALRRPGCGAHGLPSNLLASCKGRLWPDDIGVFRYVLVTAARCWRHALRCAAAPATSSSPGTAADSATSRGGSRPTAEAGGVQGGDTGARTSHQAAASELPYSARNMYDMLLPVTEYCLDKAWAVVSLPAYMKHIATVFYESLEALVECLQHMPPAAAARRLSSCWRLLVLIMAAGDDESRRTELSRSSWRLCRLLHMQQLQQPLAVGPTRAGTEASPAAAPANAPGTVTAATTGAPAATTGAPAATTGAPAATTGAPAAVPQPAAAETADVAAALAAIDAAASAFAAAAAAEAPGATATAGEVPNLQPDGPQQQRLPYTVTCAISSGVVPAFEAGLRRVFSSSEDVLLMDAAVVAVDLALRRPGCWPALLAYAKPRQVSALITTMTKLTRKAADVEPTWPHHETGPSPPTYRRDFRTGWRLQLLALLEQMAPLAPQWLGDVGDEGLEPGTASRAGGSAREVPSQKRPVPQQLQASLDLNWELCGDWVADSDARRAGRSSSSEEAACGAARGPSWEAVVRAGGCPAPGTPPQVQQAHLAVKAAVEWLPLLVSRGGQTAAMADLLPYFSYRIVWRWLLLLSRQSILVHQRWKDAVDAGDAAAATPWDIERRAWSWCLLIKLLTVEPIRTIIQLSCGGRRYNTGIAAPQVSKEHLRTGPKLPNMALELLPAALDVLEVLAVTAPDAISALMEENVSARARESAAAAGAAGGSNGAGGQCGTRQGDGRHPAQAQPPAPAARPLPPAWGPGLPFDAAVVSVLEAQGRQGLLAFLGDLAAGRRPTEFRTRVQPTSGESAVVSLIYAAVVPLPGSDFPRCMYRECTNMAGDSEATMALKDCGRCHRVSYCCVECQRADWAEGHRAKCVPSGRAGV